MTKTITIELLKEHKACENQVDKFKELFGEKIVPTRELCLLHAQDFDFGWAARFLSKQANKFYQETIAPIKKFFNEDTTTALKVFNETIAPARKVFDEAIAPAWTVYEEAIAPAEKAFKESTAPAHKVFKEATALAWFNAWESQDKA